MIPGMQCLVAAMTASTLCASNCPPSPGLAPCATFICISSALTRYSAVTPNLPEAICLTLDDRSFPSMSSNLFGSSPPSPVLLCAPMEFMASAMVSCASLLMAPKDMPSATKRLIMLSADSTSFKGMGLDGLKSIMLRMNM